MQDGKNEALLEELYKKQTGKEPLTAKGEQSKPFLDWKLKGFTPMENTLLKKFSTCTADIDSGKMSAEQCYSDAYMEAVKNGSVYLPPAYRTKGRKKEYEEKYNLSKLQEDFKKKNNIQ